MVGGQGGKSAVGGGEREGRRVDWGGGEGEWAGRCIIVMYCCRVQRAHAGGHGGMAGCGARNTGGRVAGGTKEEGV